MANRIEHRRAVQHHSNVAEAYDIVSGILVQFARKYLYLRTDRKAFFHILAVLLLSLIAAFVPLPDHYYFVRKDNILNSYFVKLGWFWTCAVVCPFIWYVSHAVGEGFSIIVQHLSRMAIATAIWYYCTHGFLMFEQMTGHCHGSRLSPRATCTTDGGKWVPGFDISGHCFILIYSILIICEESLAFRRVTAAHRTRSTPPLEYENLIKIFFLSMCALHLLWDFELLISVLYYHHVHHKVMGALIAVLCWYFTYHVWYGQLGIPPPPLRRRKISR